MLVYYSLDPMFVVLAIISISYDNVRTKVVAEMWEHGKDTAKCTVNMQKVEPDYLNCSI